jgi:hypothetical protein
LEAGVGKGWGVKGEVAKAMYTHVSKCKNDKIKGERKKLLRSKNAYVMKDQHLLTGIILVFSKDINEDIVSI